MDFTVSLNITGVQAGVRNNTTGPISATESGAGAASNTAIVTVIGPPSIAKAFGAASINLNAQTTLTFTITNPNATVALTGVAFGDTLPGGLTIATPNGLTGSCGSGTITTGTVSGFSVVNLSGGTIAAGGSCTFSINVVGTTGGHQVNTTGTVTSSNAGSGNQAIATIDVVAPGQGTVTISITGQTGVCDGQNGTTPTGNLVISINSGGAGGGDYTQLYGCSSGGTPTVDVLAAELAQTITNNSSLVTATSSGNTQSVTITITARTNGSSTNYPLAASLTTDNNGIIWYTITASSSTLTGGH